MKILVNRDDVINLADAYILGFNEHKRFIDALMKLSGESDSEVVEKEKPADVDFDESVFGGKKHKK